MKGKLMEKPEFKHSIAVYLALTFLLTWSFWITGFIIADLSDIFRIIGSLMPSTIAILLINISDGRGSLHRLLGQLLIWNTPPVCYAFVILFTLSSIYLPMWACRMLGVNYFVAVNNQIGGFPLRTPLLALLCFFTVVLFGGPVGEELGWRGFVLPHLRKKVSPLISSIIVGVIWSLWHLPMFWFHVSGYNINFMEYLLETIYLSILFTWLYERSGRSLFLVILFHSVDNFVMALFWNNFMNEWNLYTLLLWCFRLIVLAFLVIDLQKRTVK
jgi:membrane protease YdiL (CAAX protease family)